MRSKGKRSPASFLFFTGVLAVIYLLLSSGPYLWIEGLVSRKEAIVEKLDLETDKLSSSSRGVGGTGKILSLFGHFNTGSGAWTPTDGVFVDNDHFGCWQGYNTNLYVFRTSDGKRVWSHNFGEGTGRAMDSDGDHIYFTSDRDRAPLYKIKKGQWTHRSTSLSVSGGGAALRYRDGKVYVGTKRGNFEVFDANNLRSLKTYNVGGTSNLPDMWVDDTHIYYTTYSSGRLYKVNLATGNHKNVHLGGNLIGISGNEDRLVVGDRDNNRYFIIEKKNLKTLFTRNTGRTECTAVDPGGRYFYIYDHSGSIRVWDNKEDSEIQSYNIWSNYCNGMKVSGESNLLVIRDNSNKVSAYNLEGYALLPSAESVSLLDPTTETEGGEKLCFARYAPYTLSVNITGDDKLRRSSEAKLFLDYNNTNISLGYNWTRGVFYKSGDPDRHIRLYPNDCTIANDGDSVWWLNFSLLFNFSFPHEKQIDLLVNVTSASGRSVQERFTGDFRVENDLEFAGTPDFTGEYQGELEGGDWVRGGEGLTVRNLTVHYESGPDNFPEDEYFDVRVIDPEGNAWWDNESGGSEVFVNLTARNVSVIDEEYLITIENIPGAGIGTSNLSFSVKIDARAPLPPGKVTCEAYGKEAYYVKVRSINITWAAVKDNASGLRGYYYSQFDHQGTDNSTFTEETEGEVTELDEGTREVFVWAVDNVGNIGRSANSSVLIDLTAPTFRGFLPTDESWHNHTKIECSVDILDTDGSGVDPESVSYAISTEGPYTFGPWVPVWVSGGEERVRAEVKNSFNEGEENYIKWRAKDLSGNGFVESSPVNLKIDITPLTFSKEVSPEPGWYKERRITSTIFLYDLGSGLDKDSLKARVSTSGENEFGPWMEVREENVTDKDDGFELSFAYTYPEGPDNYLMFRGTDKVANPFSLSRSFNYKIDTTPVYFSNFDPPTDDFSDEKEVECLIDIYDDGIGVEPKSVEYSVSTGGEKSFGAWKRAYDVSVGNPTTVRVETEFGWGRDNFIRFRADDKMANGANTSDPFNVWVNSKPEAVISFPPNNKEYAAVEDILFDASNSTDLDGDILSYYWTSNVKENATLGGRKKMRVRLAEGNHTIILYVDDGHEYNVSETVRVNVAGEKEKGGKVTGSEGTEQRGTLGEGAGNILFWIIVGLAVVLLLIIAAILFIIRKRKVSGEEVEFVAPGAQFSSPAPYSQGQYLPDTVQTYQTGTAGRRGRQYGGLGGGPQPSRPALPARQGPIRFRGPGSPDPQPQLPAGPQPGMGQGYRGNITQPPQRSAPATPGQVLSAGSPQYSLPSFGTEQGQQDLNRPALPPAPEDPGGSSGGVEQVLFPPSSPPSSPGSSSNARTPPPLAPTPPSPPPMPESGSGAAGFSINEVFGDLERTSDPPPPN